MSNTEKMVSVPRELAEDINSALCDHDLNGLTVRLQDLLDSPAEQHQGEPVALPDKKQYPDHNAHPGRPVRLAQEMYFAEGWNNCLDEIAKLGPLYTHPAPAVQKGEPVAWVYMRNGNVNYDTDIVISNSAGDTLGDGDSWEPVYTHADPDEVEQLRTELAGRNELLHDLVSAMNGLLAIESDDDALDHLGQRAAALLGISHWKSASAEPIPDHSVEVNKKVERLRKTLELVREQRDNELRTNSSLEQERDRLRSQLAERDAQISRAIQAWSSAQTLYDIGAIISELRGGNETSAEPSAPKPEACCGSCPAGCAISASAQVERDERAGFEAANGGLPDFIRRADTGGYELCPVEFLEEYRNDFLTWDSEWWGWKTRAALERKP